jgi:ribosomal protein L9
VIQVVLRDDVSGLGKRGDVVDVADGYARNYLVPRGLAMKADKGRSRAGGGHAPLARRQGRQGAGRGGGDRHPPRAPR